MYGLDLQQGSANYGLMVRSCSPPVSTNEVLLEPGHTHSFAYGPWLLSCYSGRAE